MVLTLFIFSHFKFPQLRQHLYLSYSPPLATPSDEVVTQAAFGRRILFFSSPFGNKNIHRITATGGEHIKEWLGKDETSTWLELNIRKRPTMRPRLTIPSQAEGSSSLECFATVGGLAGPRGEDCLMVSSTTTQEALAASCPISIPEDEMDKSVSGQSQSPGSSFCYVRLKGIWGIPSRIKRGVRGMGDPKDQREQNWAQG